jgi:hypothetical protein
MLRASYTAMPLTMMVFYNVSCATAHEALVKEHMVVWIRLSSREPPWQPIFGETRNILMLCY